MNQEKTKLHYYNFVSFHTATELESLGFNEPCFGLFIKVDKELIVKEMLNQEECKLYFGGILAPLYQQCIKWLREVHKLRVDVGNIQNNLHETPLQIIAVSNLDTGKASVEYKVTKSTTAHEELLEEGINNALKIIKNESAK
jgi:uncharacterized protein YueI